MNQLVQRGLLISDFNLENLSAYLANNREPPLFRCEVAPYGQVTQTLLDSTLPCWNPPPDFTLVWTRPEAVLAGFREALNGDTVEEANLEREVDNYAETIARAGKLSKTIFVPTWNVPTMHLGHGLLDLAPGLGVSRLLMQANLRLLRSLSGIPNVVPLHASRWIEMVGEKAFNERLWHSGKIPFANEVFKIAAREIKAAIRGIGGGSRKLIVLDLDDTLWGGIVGEVGWQNLVLGGHDPMGEAFVEFQRGLKTLTKRGMLLAIASKNEETVALQAIDHHPEMVLRRGDFAAWRINWDDKARNIVELTKGLNLVLDSVVFIDDNQVERDRVRQALPEVLVPEWPVDARLYLRALCELDCFQQPLVTKEDRRRAEMYSQERQRTDSKAQASSVEEWLRTLQITVKVELLGASNIGRATQLLNKTNQMNLSTRRLTEQEFGEWASQPGHRSWVFSVSDRFGDSGLTGILSMAADGDNARIVDFVLSCRVMGRKVEETMLHWAVKWAQSSRLARVVADYSSTPKNAPCHAFFQGSGFDAGKDGRFTWDTVNPYALPDVIKLITPPEDAFDVVSGKPSAAEAGVPLVRD
ncbi:MAG TPA: HAD-IIIC family phosphatase [Candidatus Sulfopaludibacter sp.]|nr:HAD-IIIC family phosphatase [Candidatus Sulfopaludibacter sp.]